MIWDMYIRIGHKTKYSQKLEKLIVDLFDSNSKLTLLKHINSTLNKKSVDFLNHFYPHWSPNLYYLKNKEILIYSYSILFQYQDYCFLDKNQVHKFYWFALFTNSKVKQKLKIDFRTLI